jgi:plasmid stabilization system protein ParE
VIEYSRRAAGHIADLLDHYDKLERPEAMRNLMVALRGASDDIENNPAAGLPTPRPYPWLARPGQAWVKSGPYWIGYRPKPRLTIVAVFFETADIPVRL